MKKVLASLALLFATSAFSTTSTVDVRNLTPEQVAQVQKQVSELSSTPVNVSASVRKEAEAWGELGANMGKAMVGAAKEVGVASNEFAQTGLAFIMHLFYTDDERYGELAAVIWMLLEGLLFVEMFTDFSLKFVA
ncbi:hypothetical protein GHT06_001861 [Daphnia sinensis]|uniref:Uncharacterized protein n=1 Tax=Daphnia sinensis TaxID=1820382 RepID=A0AAD5KTG4_9CRUS|nr:hypothetical protein GHT06_001861 [Daphnia sinensis]